MLIEAIEIGVLSTAIMDIGAIVFSKLGIIRKPSIALLGRWIFELVNGQWIHRETDILMAQRRPFESHVGAVAHYLIGVVLAFVFLVTLGFFGTSSAGIWCAVGFGIATNALPWLIMFPSMGFGFFAKRAPPHTKLFVTSFVGHLNFGFGLWLGCLLLWK